MDDIDFFTVFFAAIVYMIIKSFWYSSFLFGTIWCKLNGIKKKDFRSKFIRYPFIFLSALILSYFISLIEVYLGANSFWDGFIVGFILWFGFVFTTQITTVINTKKTYKIFMIRNGFLLISFIFMGIILVG